jgi:RNA polymerase subunit RPABC4/transcription elongation factor Spt4
MCGCMLMHAMNHQEEHPSSSHPDAAPTTNNVADDTRCGHCGFSLQRSFTFCPNCGMNLQTAECKACGQKVDPKWRMCPHCGSPLSELQRVTQLT